MEWRYEIYRAIFVALGAMELFTNSKYLFQKDGIQNARKQHREIPASVTDQQMKRKVVMMFLFGGLFLIAGLTSYIQHNINYNFSLIVLAAFFIYAMIEAFYYRYRNTFGFLGISLLFLVLFII